MTVKYSEKWLRSFFETTGDMPSVIEQVSKFHSHTDFAPLKSFSELDQFNAAISFQALTNEFCSIFVKAVNKNKAAQTHLTHAETNFGFVSTMACVVKQAVANRIMARIDQPKRLPFLDSIITLGKYGYYPVPSYDDYTDYLNICFGALTYRALDSFNDNTKSSFACNFYRLTFLLKGRSIIRDWLGNEIHYGLGSAIGFEAGIDDC